MFDNLSDRLSDVLKTLRSQSKLTAESIDEAIREVRKALLEADVSLKVVKLFISRVRQKALGAEVLDSVTPVQQFIKTVHDELITILGSEPVPLNLKGSPGVIMLLGLQGSGKTTASAKLAKSLKKDGYSPLLVACDIQRPAATQQLQTLGKQIDIPVFTAAKNVVEIAHDAIKEAKESGYNPVIIDTAGRLQVDTELMAELLILDRSLEPMEKLLVVDAMTGQEAVNVAETFNTQLHISGVILSKVDGDARGGAALSVREAVGCPIKFMSTGEKLDALEPFYPDRMAGRILGMGDVVSLVEKAQEVIDEKEAQKVAQDMMSGQFTLEMFMQAQRMMKKMGPLGDVMKMMGLSGMMGLSSDQQKEIAGHGEVMLKLYETAINSMTPEERQQPEIINMSRRRRIAKGSGLKENELGQMLNEFEQMRNMFSQLGKMTGGMLGKAGSGLPSMPDMLGKGMGKPAARIPNNLPFGLARGSGHYRKKSKHR
jgi:signal recognition particle subunit SRP54